MFVIRGFPRCGTHMVRTALNSHPELFCHDEIFNPGCFSIDDINNRGPSGNVQHFLNSPNVGCVIHANTRRERFEGSAVQHLAWDYIASNLDKYQVLVLSRRDWLRRAASVAVARQTHRWQQMQDKERLESLPSVEIYPDFLEWQFRCQQASLLDTEQRFPEAPVYWYEDLVDNWKSEITGMQRFLGVEPMDLKPKTVKQDTRPIQEIISNYATLRRVFTGSEWEPLFVLAEGNTEHKEVV